MSVRSYTKIWLHLIWSTQNREKLLVDKQLRKELSQYYYDYSVEKKIYMKINYINPDHVHALINLPTNLTVEKVLHLYKGSSSNWLNKQVNFRFQWGKGYGAFSVSESNLDRVVKYIINQEEHHRKKSFTKEYEEFLRKHNIFIING
jgi:REP element-mobilizing transposase RayT